MAIAVARAEKACLVERLLLGQQLHLPGTEDILLLVERLLTVLLPQGLLDDLDVLELLGIEQLVLDAASYLFHEDIESDMQITFSKFELLACLYSVEVQDIFSNLLVEIEAQVVQVDGK